MTDDREMKPPPTLQEYEAEVEAAGGHVLLCYKDTRCAVSTVLRTRGQPVLETRVYLRQGDDPDLSSPTEEVFRCKYDTITEATAGHSGLEDLMRDYLHTRLDEAYRLGKEDACITDHEFNDWDYCTHCGSHKRKLT
jgi:hypothetical protein